MMMQGSPQSQSVRSDRQFPAPSDQGRLPIGALGGNPTQSTDRDRFSGSETSSANTAIQQQSSRGADLLTQSLGNYLIKSPQDVRYAMTAQVCGQPAHIAMTAIVGASNLSHSVVAQTGGSNPYSLQIFAQPDFEENVVSAADVSTQTEQQIEINEQQSSEQQKVNWKTIISELQEDIDKIDIDCVRVVTDDDDIILIEQKGKEMVKEIELIMETVESQWNIQDINWEKGLINGSDMEQIVDMFRKQLSELTKKHSILQERLEELKQAAFKKKESFSDRQELAKSEDELQLVKVRNLGEETCEIVESTKTEDHVDVLLQVEQLEPKHQIEEVSAVENSSQVQLQQASEFTMIVDVVYNESQIGLEMEMKDDKDVEAHVTQWQELKQHDICDNHPKEITTLLQILRRMNLAKWR